MLPYVIHGHYQGALCLNEQLIMAGYQVNELSDTEYDFEGLNFKGPRGPVTRGQLNEIRKPLTVK